MMFNVYVAFLQYLQYVYQKGCLYRLRSLGERQDMDITIDGFHSWMWKGLGFLLPFLYIGYFTQLYNSYTLYQLIYTHEVTWQVPVLTCGRSLEGDEGCCCKVISGETHSPHKDWQCSMHFPLWPQLVLG